MTAMQTNRQTMTHPAPPRTILLVEDEPLVREIATEEFQDAGFVVIGTSDGQTALDVLGSGRPVDLLFTDIRLIGPIDGWSLAEAARTLRPTLPVIYATGYTAEQMRLVHGGVFFKKPYRLADVIAAATRLQAD